MTDEAAKILAAAIERLANAVSFGIHVHVHQQTGAGGGTTYPSYPVIPSPYPVYPYTTCGPAYSSTNGTGGAGGLSEPLGVSGSAIPGGK